MWSHYIGGLHPAPSSKNFLSASDWQNPNLWENLRNVIFSPPDTVILGKEGECIKGIRLDL